MWLLAKGKHSKAHRNLSRLRGKVSYEKCETEFQEMVKYSSPSNNDEPSNITNFPLRGLFCSILLYSKLNMSQFYRSKRKYKCLETTFRARSYESFSFDDDIFFFHEFTVWFTIITIFSINT